MNLLMLLIGCEFLATLLTTDTVIDVTCAGDQTVVIDGRDLCEEFETTGRVKCDVGYRVVLDGQVVCPGS